MVDSDKWIYEGNDTDYGFVLGTKDKNPLFCFGINPSTAKPDNLDPTLEEVEK